MAAPGTWASTPAARKARGRATHRPGIASARRVAQEVRLPELRARFTEEVPVTAIYEGELEREIDLGPSFWATRRLWRDGASCLSQIAIPAPSPPRPTPTASIPSCSRRACSHYRDLPRALWPAHLRAGRLRACLDGREGHSRRLVPRPAAPRRGRGSGRPARRRRAALGGWARCPRVRGDRAETCPASLDAGRAASGVDAMAVRDALGGARAGGAAEPPRATADPVRRGSGSGPRGCIARGRRRLRGGEARARRRPLARPGRHLGHRGLPGARSDRRGSGSCRAVARRAPVAARVARRARTRRPARDRRHSRRATRGRTGRRPCACGARGARPRGRGRAPGASLPAGRSRSGRRRRHAGARPARGDHGGDRRRTQRRGGAARRGSARRALGRRSGRTAAAAPIAGDRRRHVSRDRRPRGAGAGGRARARVARRPLAGVGGAGQSVARRASEDRRARRPGRACCRVRRRCRRLRPARRRPRRHRGRRCAAAAAGCAAPRRRARRRRAAATDPRPVRGRHGAEGDGSLAPARAHRGPWPAAVRVVLVVVVSAGIGWSGQLRGRECVSRRPRVAAPRSGPAGAVDPVGLVGRHRDAVPPPVRRRARQVRARARSMSRPRGPRSPGCWRLHPRRMSWPSCPPTGPGSSAHLPAPHRCSPASAAALRPAPVSDEAERPPRRGPAGTPPSAVEAHVREQPPRCSARTSC